MNSPDKNTMPGWLKDLQQKSWEPEILLSGIVLYGMFQVPELLDQFLFYFKSNVFGQASDLDNMIAILKVGIYWLISGLIFHLISRGIWVGLVGLSYTFPSGVKPENVEYKGRFKDRISSLTTIEKSIVQLEKISSSLFSVSFMLFMSLLGGYLYMFLLIILPFLLLIGVFDNSFDSDAVQYLQYYSWPIVIVGIVAMFDFISLGLVKRVSWLEKIYWPIHKFVSFLTFGRFYSKVYYAFVTNTNKWYFSFLLILFIITSLMGAFGSAWNEYEGDAFSRIELWHTSSDHMSFPGHYADDNSVKKSGLAHIQSDIISGNTIKMFLVADIDVEDSIKSNINYDSLFTAEPKRSAAALDLIAIDEFYHIYLDDSLINVEEWMYHYQSNTKQRGYLTYLDITELDKGLHRIKIKPPEEQFGERTWTTIKFYRER
jgi:hypothetical protein